jgi:hypothetical protein
MKAKLWLIGGMALAKVSVGIAIPSVPIVAQASIEPQPVEAESIYVDVETSMTREELQQLIWIPPEGNNNEVWNPTMGATIKGFATQLLTAPPRGSGAGQTLRSNRR